MVRTRDPPSELGQLGDVQRTQTSSIYLCQLNICDSKTNFMANSTYAELEKQVKTPTSISSPLVKMLFFILTTDEMFEVFSLTTPNSAVHFPV